MTKCQHASTAACLKDAYLITAKYIVTDKLLQKCRCDFNAVDFTDKCLCVVIAEITWIVSWKNKR